MFLKDILIDYTFFTNNGLFSAWDPGLCVIPAQRQIPPGR